MAPKVIKHFSHEEHPLRLREGGINIHDINCEICGVDVTAPLYACELCRFYLHKSCAELPRQINHPLHPSHPLYLRTQRNYWCNSCRRSFRNALSFRCQQCDFDLHMECAQMPIATEQTSTSGGQGQIKSFKHFSHPHSLHLLVATDEDEIECVACGLTCSAEAYGCKECDFFLDKSCLDHLQEHIKLPSHLAPLSLLNKSRPFTCQLCQIFIHRQNNFTFECGQCEFQMCVKCSKIPIRRNFEYEDHQHLLCFVEKMCSKWIGQCYGHDSYCAQPIASSSKEFGSTQHSVWQCLNLDCDFVLHLLCGPLPSVIKHECHVDPLTLVDSIIEDHYDEYYCDVCETTTDPRIRVYCCKDCKYFAHVHCIIPEIVKVMTGKLEPHVKLKNIGEDIWKVVDDDDPFLDKGKSTTTRPLTLKDLINDLPNYEKQVVRNFYRWDGDDYKDHDEKKKQELASHDRKTATYDQDNYYNKLLVDEDQINDVLRLSRFTDDIEFNNELQQGSANQKVELKSSDLSSTILKVKGGYMIPRHLSGVLKALINRYGNIMHINSSDETTLRMKSFVYFILCQVVRRMRSTLVKDITKTHLRELFFHLKFLYWNDTKIYYLIIRPVTVLMRSFLGLQVKRLEEEIPKMLKKKIALLQEVLKKCEEYRGPSTKSVYMTNCLNMASEFERKHAFEDFI